jgi:hypothetical protein
MTDAQWKVEAKRISDNAEYELRKFRKKCVTQGIVMFVRDVVFYQMKYRGRFVCYLYGHDEEGSKLRAAWNTIKIAEKTIEKIEGVKHEGK